MMSETNTSATPDATRSDGASAPAVNIEQLAAKVYQLMLEDARLARARGATQRSRKNGYGN